MQNQDKIYLPYFWGQKYRVIEKLVEFNGLKCVFEIFFLYE